jgi:general secretion pathway protein D
MMKTSLWQRLLALLMVISLLTPVPALAMVRGGRKNFKEGQKYEILQQWDLAAQQFALAVAAEPNDPEYKLHYLRALQQASLMFVKRGDALAEQGDYGGAYSAYRQAYSYDQGNEISKLKMERMLQLQKNLAAGVDGGVPNKIGNIFPTTSEIQFSRKERPRELAQTISFKEAKFKTIVSNIGRQLDLNVVFDESVKDTPITIELNHVTLAKSLDIILKIYKYSFEQVDYRTILVYADNATNRPRFETLMVKTFYLGNLTSQQARTALTALLPAGRQVAAIDQPNTPGGNMILVKATATELQLVQDLLDSLDKNKNEVVLDVEIYEVSHDSLLQLGNQIVSTALNVTETRLDSTGKPVDYPLGSTASLNNLGGVGRANAGKIVGNSFTPFLGGIGTLIGLPPTQLSLLQSRGDAKLLNRAQVHVLDGGKNQTKVGRSVPVRLGTTYGFGGFGAGGAATGAAGVTGGLGATGGVGGFGFPGIDSIQYRDVGLVIEAKPTITNEGFVEIEMKFETSDIVSSGSDATNLTPSFTQRSLNTTARIQDGVTAVVAGINTESKGNSRASIPVLGMIPILGRFITTPRQEGRQSDLIITVTPHIVRSQGINGDDHLAKFAGQAQAGPTPSVEDVVYRAQLLEERERRLNATPATPGGTAGAGPVAPASVAPATAPSAPTVPSQTGGNPAGSATPSQNPATSPATAKARPLIINDQVIASSGIVPNSVSAAAVGGGDSGRPPARPAVPTEPLAVPGPAAPGESPAVKPAGPAASAAPAGPGGGELVRAPATEAAPSGVAIPGVIQEGAEKTPGEAGATEGEETSTLVQSPPSPVQPAVLRSVRRPENVERAIAQARAEAEKRRREQKVSTQPTSEAVPMPAELAAFNPKQPVAPAIPVVANRASNTPLLLSFAGNLTNTTVGKTAKVDIEATAQRPMSISSLAVRFDTSKLKVNVVTPGELLGAQPQFSFKVEDGLLIIKLSGKPVMIATGSGRLATIEFSALAAGQSEVAVDSSATDFKDTRNSPIQWKASSGRVVIAR